MKYWFIIINGLKYCNNVMMGKEFFIIGLYMNFVEL